MGQEPAKTDEQRRHRLKDGNEDRNRAISMPVHGSAGRQRDRYEQPHADASFALLKREIEANNAIAELISFLEREGTVESTKEHLAASARAIVYGRKRIARHLLLIACLEHAGQCADAAEASLERLLVTQIVIEKWLQPVSGRARKTRAPACRQHAEAEHTDHRIDYMLPSAA
jgi:hypothetical protein